MRERIDQVLSSPQLRAKGARALLEVLRDAAAGDHAAREDARRALERREGKAIAEAAFAKRLERLNAALAKASPPLRIVSERGKLRIDDGTPELEARLAERSRKETLREGVGQQPPRAAPESLLVLFSYAWQPEEAQQNAQLDLYDRLIRLVNYKPPEFESLPRIELWRDAERIENAHPGKAQIEEACDRAFLVLAMMSRKYPNSDPCMMEFDRFVDAKGDNLPGKAAIVVAVNCKHIDVDRRFSHNERLWEYDGEATLVEAARRGEPAKDRFARKIAREIWLAARRYLGGGAGEPAGDGAPDRIEQAILRRAPLLDREKLVPPRARGGKTSAEAAEREAAAAADGEGADILKHLTEWAERRNGPRLTALLGDFGMGKTVACQMLTQRLLERRRADPASAPLPIYLDLREIRDAKAAGAADIETLMADMLRRVGEEPLDPKEVIRYARERGALAIFDGLDEVTNKLTTAEAEALYRTILRVVPDEDWAADREARRAAPSVEGAADAKRKRGRPRLATARAASNGPLLLVSCRTHFFRDLAAQRAFLVDKDRAGLDASTDLQIWFMLPFNREQIESYLKQNLGEADAARALAMIESTYNVKDLSTRPILLKFFSETFRALEEEKLKGATIDIGKLYEAFVDQTLSRDEPKHVIPIREKKLLLAELALHLHVEGLNAIANDDLDAWLTREIEAEPALRKLQWGAGGESALSRFELFLQDLRNATLLVRPGEKEFRFGHTSAREFFLAEALHRHVREGRLATLGAAPVTAETVEFLLARQRNGATAREAARFGEKVARLAAPGGPLDLRRFAAEAIFRAGGDLAWPPVADFSDFDFTGAHFVAPGGGARAARPSPPAAIWRGARLHDATFEGLALRGHDFRAADASSSLWVDCDFSGAATTGLDLSAAELRRCRADAPLAARDLFAESLDGGGALAGWRARRPLARREAALDRWTWPWGDIAVLSLDGRAALASGSDDGTIRVWDLATGRTLRRLAGHSDFVTSLAALSLDGRAALASGAGDGTIRVWDLATGKSVRRLEGHSGPVSSLAGLSLDGRAALAAGSGDGTIHVWDAATGNTVRRLEGHSLGVWRLAALNLDGRAALASSSGDGAVRVWDLATGKTLRRLEGHSATVTSLAALSVDGRAALAAGSEDRTVRVWDVATGNTMRRLEGHSDGVSSLAALSLDGRAALASGSGDGTIRVWDLTTSKTQRCFEGHFDLVTSLAAPSLGGRTALASAADDGTVRLWDLATGKTLRRLEGQPNGAMNLAALSLDGRAALASNTYDRTIRVWDLATGKILRRLEGHSGRVGSLAALDLDGRAALASGSYDGTIRVWDLATGKRVRRLAGHSGGVWSLAALSLDGRAALASGSGDKTIRVWDLATGKSVRRLEGHSDGVSNLTALSLDGRAALASSDGKTSRIWDVATGKTLRRLKGQFNWAMSLASLSLDGRAALASDSDDGAIRVWDPSTGGEIARLDLGLGRVEFVEGAEPGSLIAWSRLVATIDAASVAALVAKRGIVRMRQLALDPDYQGSFVDTERDAATGELLKATVGPEAWRDFVAVGADADGRQSVRPIEDLAM
jgi:WD40 repeat protein/uncharacterized protein YjbI with pentapeptide repeats